MIEIMCMFVYLTYYVCFTIINNLQKWQRRKRVHP
jgi:hypothetical protein